MRLIREIAGIAIGIALLAPAASAQDVPCAAYQNDAEWRAGFWHLSDVYTKRADGVELKALDDAISALRIGQREAGMALLSQAAGTTDSAGYPPLLAMVAGFMQRVLLACPDLSYAK